MSPEPNELPKFTDYPVNLFEEPRDHANQWDVGVLWPDSEPQPHSEKLPVPVDEE